MILIKIFSCKNRVYPSIDFYGHVEVKWEVDGSICNWLYFMAVL